MSSGAELILTAFSGADILMIQGDHIVGELQAMSAKEISRKEAFFAKKLPVVFSPSLNYIEGSLIIVDLSTDLWDGSKDFDIVAIWSEKNPEKRSIMKKALKIVGADIIGEELYQTPPLGKVLCYIARTYIREIEDLDALKSIVKYYD